MPLNFQLVEQNPNDTTGGGGSLAGPEKDTDAKGPYFVWPNQEFESGASPFAVVAASEVRAMAQALAEFDSGKTEALSGGEDQVVTLAAQPGHPGYPGYTSPVYDLDDANQADLFVEALRQASR